MGRRTESQFLGRLDGLWKRGLKISMLVRSFVGTALVAVVGGVLWF